MIYYIIRNFFNNNLLLRVYLLRQAFKGRVGTCGRGKGFTPNRGDGGFTVRRCRT